MCVQKSVEVRRGCQIPSGIGVKGNCKSPCGCWELNLVLLYALNCWAISSPWYNSTNIFLRCWSGCLVTKSVYSSCEGPKFTSQHLCQASYNHLFLRIQGIQCLCPLFVLFIHGIHSYAHITKSNKNKILKIISEVRIYVYKKLLCTLLQINDATLTHFSLFCFLFLSFFLNRFSPCCVYQAALRLWSSCICFPTARNVYLHLHSYSSWVFLNLFGYCHTLKKE